MDQGILSKIAPIISRVHDKHWNDYVDIINSIYTIFEIIERKAHALSMRKIILFAAEFVHVDRAGHIVMEM